MPDKPVPVTAVPLPAEQRMAMLAETGLTAAPDAGMDRFARLVSSLLRVPVSLVSLVGTDRQVFPGMIGLEEPWASRRETPLSHSLCQHVTASGLPLILSDVRKDEVTCTTLAIGDLGVVAYAGMPLTDAENQVLGSLCAIDHVEREWAPQELQDLSDLAAACSAELRLRLSTRQAAASQRQAEIAQRLSEASRAMAERSRAEAVEARARVEQLHAEAVLAQSAAEESGRRAEAMAHSLGVSLERSELLLRAARELGDAASLPDLRRRVGHLVRDAGPSYVSLALIEGPWLRLVPDPEAANVLESVRADFLLDQAWPAAEAVRENRLVVVADRAALVAGYGDAAVTAYDTLGLHTLVCVPLPGTRGVLGSLVLGWDRSHSVDTNERSTLTAFAGYTGRAVERVLFVDERITVARQLQEAMLTDLPAVRGLELAALYRPAAQADMVGGDWYDAYWMQEASVSGGPLSVPGSLALTVGDIMGHDMHAATVMGQVRSMLRQADHDLPGATPAQTLAALETACATLGLAASGTLLHARLTPVEAGRPGAWRMTWTNAGHPPPLLVLPGGGYEALGAHDHLLHHELAPAPRTVAERVLAPGSLLLIYTDGLVERRRHDIDIASPGIAAVLADHTRHALPDFLERVVRATGENTEDDVVLLAIRVRGAG